MHYKLYIIENNYFSFIESLLKDDEEELLQEMFKSSLLVVVELEFLLEDVSEVCAICTPF